MEKKDKGVAMEKKDKGEKPEDQEVKTEEVVGSKRKRRSAEPKVAEVKVEPRTPLKRQRVPVQKFQSPAEELGPMPSTSKQKDQIEMLHKKGCFLGVRGDEGSFYLCKTAQNVFSNTRKFKIQWLDLDEPPDVYKIDFLDTTDADCILTNVRMDRVARDTFRLPLKEQTRVEQILNKALKKERGEPIDDIIQIVESGDDDHDTVDTEEEEEEEEDWEDEPTPKKVKVQAKSRKSVTIKDKKESKSKTKTAIKDKSKDKKKPKKEEKKRGPDKNLKPNPKIKILEKEPFFETKEKTDFISKTVHGKLAIRAVLTKDMKLLKSLVSDSDSCYKLDMNRSVDVCKTALHYALENNDHEAIKILGNDYFVGENERLKKSSPQSVLIQAADTGRYNRMSLGIAAVRQISAARGGKQGNDAFVMDIEEEKGLDDYMTDALKLGVTKETFDTLLSSDPNGTLEENISSAFDTVYLAVLCGNRKLAGKLVEDAIKYGEGNGFGYLHKDVLLFDKEELRATILASSVKKKPWSNKSITPLHCAAINPNVTYLQRLLTVEPNINLEDGEHRRPIHFAAVCDGVAPLEFLLQRGASPMEIDNQGMTPLHYACSAGRPRNVDILLKKAKEAAAKQEDLGTNKWGAGGVDKPSRSSYCPIHIAVTYNHADVLKILIKHQVDVGRPLSAGKNKVTPLMIAAGHGSLEIARILVQNGASIEQLDKLKRSALTHAVMNGNTNVTSYLLYLGADPNRSDSSGNCLVHYAAAYGWHFPLKLLLDAGAEPNPANLWKTTPIAISFLKGHTGIVDYLLNQPGVDINFKSDTGETLASIAASSALVEGLADQMRYLLDKKADPTSRDANGFDTLHHLACNSVLEHSGSTDGKRQKISVEIGQMLLDAGCDPTSRTDDGRTALMLAIEKLNVDLVRLLVGGGGTVTSHKSDDGKTLLHMMAELCMDTDMSPILKILVQEKTDASDKVIGQVSKTSSKPVTDKDALVSAENGESNGDDSPPEGGVTKDREESMEVDKGEGKTDRGKGDIPKENGKGDAALNGDVNGMEIDDGVPSKVDAYVAQVSQIDIWPIMAAEMDNNGYTPLLLACKVYRDYKKQYNATDEVVKGCSERGRNFISALIELTGCDVSATVGEKAQHSDIQEGDELDRYNKDGKSSVLHLLLHVGHETVENISGLGLALVLKHKPYMEHRNMNGETALILAVEANSGKAVEMLIAAGADVNVTFGDDDTGYKTPLHVAAEANHGNIVKLLLDAKAKVNVPNSKTKETALHLAVQCREDEATALDIVRMLLAAGADTNIGPTTPLHYAVLANLGSANSSTEIEEYLISKGANVFARDEEQRVPLHMAFITKSSPSSTKPLDPIELCSVLTDSMANKMLDCKDTKGRTPLHMAACRGATISCVHLLQRKVNLQELDSEGFSALSMAVKNKHDSCAIMLIQKGANVEDNIVVPPAASKDLRKYYEMKKEGRKLPIWEWTPSKIVGQLPEKEKHLDIYQMAIGGELQGVAHMVLDSTGITGKAVEAALKVNKYHIALRHLQRIKHNSILRDYKNADGQNLLHILALFTKPLVHAQLQLKVSNILIEKGVSLTQLDKYGRYPLVYVVYKHQQVKLAELFIEKGKGTVNLNKEDKFGRTAIVAYFWDQDKLYGQGRQNEQELSTMMGLLLREGAKLDILYSVSGSETPHFDVMFPDCPLDFFSELTYSGKRSPLIAALYNCDFGLTSYLLNKGAASPNMPDENGITPLMHCVKGNDVSLVKLLLNHDYDVSKHTSSTDQAKLGLRKVLSRRVFAITAPRTRHDTLASQLDEDTDDDGSDILDNKFDSQSDNEGANNNKEPEEDDFIVDDDGSDDSDHDTDIVDDDDDDSSEHDHSAQHLPIPRLGSKQPSIKRMGTSQTSTEEFVSVEKTSDVDLDARDNRGWTVIHHLVSPLNYGTYDSEEILYVLYKAGANLSLENKDGDTPLKLALNNSAFGLARRLQTYIGLESDKLETPTITKFYRCSESDDSLSMADANMYEADADSMLHKVTQKLTDEELAAKSKPKVDKQCLAADVGDVVIDLETKVPYDIILSKIEIKRFLSDTYNFYKMQIIHHKVKDIYILFTKWGRIGDSGQYQQTPFQKLPEAVTNFCKIFKSKTGNLWSNLKSFKNQAKKYRPVITDYEPYPVKKVEFQLQSSIPSKLPAQIQELLKIMASVELMQTAMKKAKMEEEYMPFGRIKRDALIEARKILQTIGDKVVEMEKKKRTEAYNNDDHQQDCELLAKLTTDFYSLTPRQGYEHWKISPFTDTHQIKHEMRVLSNLLDLEVASKMMLAAQYKLNECNPLDYIYQAVGCSIQPLREDDVESQYILKYIRNSSSARVLCIYKLCRSGEDDRLKKLNLANHKLLWHGSGTANFLSILHNGLLVAPPEAPMTGHAFGEGVYTSDCFAKSEMYCDNYSMKSQEKLALLCEGQKMEGLQDKCMVGLGNCKEDVDTSSNTLVDLINTEYNSLKIHGQKIPQKDWDISLPYGAKLPLGSVEDNKFRSASDHGLYVMYNEYIVQDHEQISLRYLVQFV